jgi:YVTN family beta-propeller protein
MRKGDIHSGSVARKADQIRPASDGLVGLTLLVLHKLEDSFGYYDVATGRETIRIRTRPFPHEICLDPSKQKIYIAEMGVRGIESEGAGGHTISVTDLKSKKEISLIDTGKYDRPHGITTFGERLYVTSESTQHLLVYDLVSEELIRAVYLGQECAHMVTVSPDGGLACTANILSNTITLVDTESLKVIEHISVPERPEGMVFSPDGNIIYCVCREAYSVALIDRHKTRMTGQIETGNGPVRIVITPDGSRLGIPLFHSASVQLVDTGSGKVTHTIPVGPHPAGAALSSDGNFLFISCEEENMVYVIDLENNGIVQKIKTGNGADAMVCVEKNDILVYKK